MTAKERLEVGLVWRLVAWMPRAASTAHEVVGFHIALVGTAESGNFRLPFTFDSIGRLQLRVILSEAIIRHIIDRFIYSVQVDPRSPRPSLDRFFSKTLSSLELMMHLVQICTRSGVLIGFLQCVNLNIANLRLLRLVIRILISRVAFQFIRTSVCWCTYFGLQTPGWFGMLNI